MARHPSRMRSNWHRDVRYADARNFVSVCIQCGNKAWIRLTNTGWNARDALRSLRSEVYAPQCWHHRWVEQTETGNRRKLLQRSLARNGSAVRQSRERARRRFDTLRCPAIQVNKERTLRCQAV